MENPELIAYLKTVDTATLANAIELLALRPRAEGYASLDLKCLFPSSTRWRLRRHFTAQAP